MIGYKIMILDVKTDTLVGLYSKSLVIPNKIGTVIEHENIYFGKTKEHVEETYSYHGNKTRWRGMCNHVLVTLEYEDRDRLKFLKQTFPKKEDSVIKATIKDIQIY